MSKIGVDSIKIKEITLEGNFNNENLLVFEESLEIRIGFGSEPERQQMSLSVTIRTPGNWCSYQSLSLTRKVVRFNPACFCQRHKF